MNRRQQVLRDNGKPPAEVRGRNDLPRSASAERGFFAHHPDSQVGGVSQA